jgi:RNA polymerase sigma factor (sigma-70 family)
MTATPFVPASPLCELALSARDGDRSALDRLLGKLYERVPGLVRCQLVRVNAWLDASALEDVVQEVMVAVARRDVPRFDETRGSFATLLAYRIRWCLADHLRRLCRRSETVNVEDEAEVLAAPETCEPEQALSAARAELRLLVLQSEVEDALADQPRARQAVVAHDIEGKRLEDIAQELDAHTSTACRQRQKGLRLLAERLPDVWRQAA